jgi:hypothetical protein
MEGDMNVRHILLLAASALTLALVIAGPAAAKPGPLSGDQIVGQSRTDSKPASAYYTPAALRAYGLRMQAMARTSERLSVNGAASPDSFDVRDALVGAAGGIGIVICAGGLILAVSRSRRPQVAL